MKKAIIVIVIILCTASLYSADPVVKFYLQDGSTKQYKISEIGNFDFIKSNLSFSMRTYSRNKGTTDYDIRSIDSVSLDSSKITIAFPGNVFTENLWEIDSILFVWNTCQEIQIGTQIWMCRNLDVDHYRNGDSIPEVRDTAEWANLKTGAWCYYNNDPAMGKIYGKLYNWYAVNDPRGLAPEDWKIGNLGSFSHHDGGKLKSTGTKEAGDGLWWSPNEGATNESGFSALPGGFRGSNGLFDGIGGGGGWWSTTGAYDTGALYWVLTYSYDDIDSKGTFNSFGFSVRCIKD